MGVMQSGYRREAYVTVVQHATIHSYSKLSSFPDPVTPLKPKHNQYPSLEAARLESGLI